MHDLLTAGSMQTRGDAPLVHRGARVNDVIFSERCLPVFLDRSASRLPRQARQGIGAETLVHSIGLNSVVQQARGCLPTSATMTYL